MTKEGQHHLTHEVKDSWMSGACPNVFPCSSEGIETPLLLAGREGHIDVFKLLIEAGASGRDTVDFGGTVGLYSRTQASIQHEYSLIPGALETMTTLCKSGAEFERMFARVVARLSDIYSQLE
uniref:Uncharacterized protein n=1 Tax=Globisporangium ultimum (strain ATCC 200006 / CBS 805.95 / DAOM BR144) TaxID=431595 RepID=K3X974_GLOUD